MSDLRRAVRSPVSLKATCSLAGREFRVLVSDLSDLGCFVATEEPARPGAALALTLERPDGSSVERAGTVVRVAGRRDDHIGFAVEFESGLEPEDEG